MKVYKDFTKYEITLIASAITQSIGYNRRRSGRVPVVLYELQEYFEGRKYVMKDMEDEEK